MHFLLMLLHLLLQQLSSTLLLLLLRMELNNYLRNLCRGAFSIENCHCTLGLLISTQGTVIKAKSKHAPVPSTSNKYT